MFSRLFSSLLVLPIALAIVDCRCASNSGQSGGNGPHADPAGQEGPPTALGPPSAKKSPSEKGEHPEVVVPGSAPSRPPYSGPPCNSAPLPATTVKEMQVAAASPPAQGGTLTSGTYVLTSRTLYTGQGGATGPSGPAEGQVAVVTVTGDMALVQITRDTEPKRMTISLKLKEGSSEFLRTEICPPPAKTESSAVAYTATPTTLTFVGDGPTKNRLLVFTKQ